MNGANICKFIPSPLADQLSVSCFVLETDPRVMEARSLLKENRVFLIKSGEGHFSFGGDTVDGGVGDLLFGFRGETFSATCEKDTAYLYVSFTGLRADELFRRFNISPKNRLFRGHDGLIPLWSDSLARANGETIDLAAESILLYTFSRLFGEEAPKSDLIRTVIRVTEERYTDPTHTLSALAEELSYNAKYLSHTFKKRMGVSYSEYLSTLRIKHAVALLDMGLDSVKNVAVLSGFSDPLYFSTVFKRKMGISPAGYLKKQ